ncbi:MAG: hypothetical protein A2X36_06625 [Elusimicrobia bacterium GWA2_69_24]|nr:MAG: hypothetical protein A2X36_06625 [Elusimicrobia bacterium GWA2_69_24]HBL17968.1 6-pyruvoyl tetrahydrobiopterin synthase [Elusimicrobiota bacterium]
MSGYRVFKRIGFCYGHRLLRYRGKCRHLHGHNAVLDVEVAAPGLDRLGMVMDFSLIRDKVKTWVDRTLDHKTILAEDDPLVPVLRRLGEPIVTMKGNPTAETIARLVYDRCRRLGLPVSAVRLWESDTSCAEYRGEIPT